MDKNELIKYWIRTSERDYNTMLNLYESKDYHWSLFIGHLVIEKLLKALYIIDMHENPPRIHDLLRIANMLNLETTEEQRDILDLITTFNISARYPDYKQSFYKICTREYAEKNIKKIKELREWLLSMINQR
jgi:HEPN domain-containing protein